ncbi:helix-turn-helix transcriptional regulator [Herbiconiux sp. CPCC 205763]|uniref:Helix-turn-helix transcriptional regulator n=1 Tax=Herbiconiux aconitum TaxID=2970913 RepID=A0ABT2GU27_9MICO|nr:helix-turn-helix transcriptional regulator [Herbiconiux aconitum]MCS5719722.1 helix-turn-helix transcriptional regulator [Herbiconiux aconitum]
MESWEFGRMLRHRRDGVAPETVGLSTGGHRRATGLRREELAALTGISADYLTRLEQGRATSPSAQVVEALARALRLSDADRELFYRLAGLTVPGVDVVPSRISPSVQRLLDRFANTPLAVYDAAMTLLVANAPYEALLGVNAKARGIERNAIWRNLVGPGTRTVMTAAEKAAFEAGIVAELRLTAARYPADRALRRLVRELAAQSPRFASLWESDEVTPRHDPARRKVIEHPTVGRITLDCDTLVVAGDDLRVMIYTAEPGTEDAERLALAIVLGTQTLVE